MLHLTLIDFPNLLLHVYYQTLIMTFPNLFILSHKLPRFLNLYKNPQKLWEMFPLKDKSKSVPMYIGNNQCLLLLPTQLIALSIWASNLIFLSLKKKGGKVFSFSPFCSQNINSFNAKHSWIGHVLKYKHTSLNSIHNYIQNAISFKTSVLIF